MDILYDVNMFSPCSSLIFFVLLLTSLELKFSRILKLKSPKLWLKIKPVFNEYVFILLSKEVERRFRGIVVKIKSRLSVELWGNRETLKKKKGSKIIKNFLKRFLTFLVFLCIP